MGDSSQGHAIDLPTSVRCPGARFAQQVSKQPGLWYGQATVLKRAGYRAAESTKSSSQLMIDEVSGGRGTSGRHEERDPRSKPAWCPSQIALTGHSPPCTMAKSHSCIPDSKNGTDRPLEGCSLTASLSLWCCMFSMCVYEQARHVYVLTLRKVDDLPILTDLPLRPAGNHAQTLDISCAQLRAREPTAGLRASAPAASAPSTCLLPHKLDPSCPGLSARTRTPPNMSSA